MTSPPQPRTWKQRLRRWGIALLAGYLGAIIVLLLLENWLVYHPAGPDDWVPPPRSGIHNVEFISSTGDKIHGWWHPRPGSHGAVLYFHGNAGNFSHRGEFVCFMGEQLGESVLIVDYPGYGKSSGRPSETGCYAAADAAYDWLTKTQGIQRENIIFYGASIGGGVAVDLASRKPHRALILVKTFTSTPDVGQGRFPFLPIRWLMRNRFDSLSKLDRCKQPIFIAHGDADTIVPFSHGQRLFEAAAAPKEFLLLPGADHNNALPNDFFIAVKKFLAQAAPLPVPAAN